MVSVNAFTTEYNKAAHLKKLLKKLMRKKFARLTKILTAPEGGDCQVDEFLRLGIAAVVVKMDEATKWMN